MAKARVRVDVTETGEMKDVTLDLEADPAAVAQGIASQLGLPPGRRYFRLRDSFVLRDGATVELVPDSGEAFVIH